MGWVGQCLWGGWGGAVSMGWVGWGSVYGVGGVGQCLWGGWGGAVSMGWVGWGSMDGVDNRCMASQWEALISYFLLLISLRLCPTHIADLVLQYSLSKVRIMFLCIVPHLHTVYCLPP